MLGAPISAAHALSTMLNYYDYNPLRAISAKPSDSIRLRFPWGLEKQMPVPAATPSNPVYSWRPRG